MTSAVIAGRSTVHLQVLSAGALKYVATGFAPQFTDETGDQVEFTFGTIGGRAASASPEGETADIIMGTAAAIAQMEQSGVLTAGSRVDLGRTLTGLCVRAGAPLPDISTPEQLQATLLAASAVAYTDPRAGGTSGIFLVGLLERSASPRRWPEGPPLRQRRRRGGQGHGRRGRDRLDLPQRDRADAGRHGRGRAAATDGERHRLRRRRSWREATIPRRPAGSSACWPPPGATPPGARWGSSPPATADRRALAALEEEPRRRGAQTVDDAHTNSRPQPCHDNDNKTMGEDSR